MLWLNEGKYYVLVTVEEHEEARAGPGSDRKKKGDGKKEDRRE
jgi:hypothetical protein